MLEQRDVTSLNDAIGAPESAVGQTSRRSLRAGEVLRQGQLASPVLVKRGAPVNIVARKEQVQVSMDGVAMDATPRRFQTFEDLEPYCHRVASSSQRLKLVSLAESFPSLRPIARGRSRHHSITPTIG